MLANNISGNLKLYDKQMIHVLFFDCDSLSGARAAPYDERNVLAQQLIDGVRAQRLAHHLRGPVRHEVVHVLLQHVARDPEYGPLEATSAERARGGGA